MTTTPPAGAEHDGPPIFGREPALATWRALAEQVGAGRSGGLAFTGSAGVGKTALIEWIRGDARRRSWASVAGAGAQATQQLPGHVLWQLFGSLAARARAGEPPFDGPGQHLHTFLLGDRRDVDETALTFAAAWVLRTLTEDEVVLVVVDDLQWSDELSLKVVAALPHLVRDDRVALVVGVRDPETASAATQGLLEESATTHVALEPLRRRDVAQWVKHATGAASTETVTRLHAASAGLPYLVGELLAGGAETESDATELLRRRLSTLTTTQREVLDVIVRLGDLAVDELVTAVTGHDRHALAHSYDALRRLRLLAAGTPLRVTHPLVGEATLSVADPPVAAEVHARIATSLSADGHGTAVVATHLLHTAPGDDPVTTDLLVQAGLEALASGSATAASQLLDRARRQTNVPTRVRTRITTAAGRAHLRAGRIDVAVARWRSDWRELSFGERAERLLDIGDAELIRGCPDEGSAAYAAAVDILATADQLAVPEDVQHRVWARLSLTGFFDASAGQLRHQAVETILSRSPAEDGPAERALLSYEALRSALTGESAERAGDLAARAVRDGLLLQEDGPEGTILNAALASLCNAERDTEALAVADEALARARARGSVLGHASISYLRGALHARRGRLRLAQADLESAVAAREYGWSAFLESAVQMLVQVHLARDDHDAAKELLELVPLDRSRQPLMRAAALHAHAAVALAEGAHETALDRCIEAMDLTEAFRGPVFSWWRRDAIRAAVVLQRGELAQSVAEDIVVTAESFGAPRGLGTALRAAATAEPFEQAVATLRRAIGLLAAHDGHLEHAEACADLASLLLQAGHSDESRRSEAVTWGTRAIAAAERIGARRVVREVSALLEGLEVTPEVAPATRLDRLSPGELRVCELAMQGMSNRQIAEHLFITVKGVEWHLSKSYAKLGVRSRRELIAQAPQS
ncbi:AAA family ATPase [Aeromicrobium sp. NPDC092404]|uniref:helix-turn-helix transcriptional regulator n=1 Tax=Aeromicrobium sp. NPDC092404 TaxID=3154976 RepID=UPI00342F21BC